MGLVAVHGHLDAIVCRPRWGWLQNFAATVGRSNFNSGLSSSSFTCVRSAAYSTLT